MTEEKRLAKIRSVKYGFGGYQGAMLGISFDLGGDGWGVSDFWGGWGPDIECTKSCKWTEESRITNHGEVSMRIGKLLREAKVETVDKLKGTPIEVTFDNDSLRSWRVLKEVL